MKSLFLNGSRLVRGLASIATNFAFPLGSLPLIGTRRFVNSTRLNDGLIIVLPGIEGGSSLNWNIAEGLNDGSVRSAIAVFDWTTGFWPLFLFHLRGQRRNRRQAGLIADAIISYHKSYPGRPVHLVGHSGGGAMAVWVLEALPKHLRVTSALLLGAALSPQYPLGTALRKTELGVWNFWSPFDFLYLAAGTMLFGTMDGPNAVSAGCCGFRMPRSMGGGDVLLYKTHLHQLCFTPAMLKQFHWGGHFGWANRVFVAEEIAPLMKGCERLAA